MPLHYALVLNRLLRKWQVYLIYALSCLFTCSRIVLKGRRGEEDREEEREREREKQKEKKKTRCELD